VHKFYRAGIFVNAGFIVGFDGEPASVAAGMVTCIEDAAIPLCMVGPALCAAGHAARAAAEARKAVCTPGSIARPPIGTPIKALRA